MEIILFFLQPYSLLKGNYITFYNSEEDIYVTYTLNDLMCALMVLRTIPMFLMMFAGVKYNSNRSDRIW